jgi:superfamily II DNA or RNA helicase
MGLGLGKTVCALTALETLLTVGDCRAALVVAPLRVATLTWPNEVEKWAHTRHLRTANLRTKEGWAMLLRGAADLYLINYESLPRLCSQYFEKHRGTPAFDTVIFDELTRAKSHKSSRIKMLRRHLGSVTRRWGLTGTPNPNSLLELFAQIRLLDDGAALGASYETFKRTYFFPTDYMEYDWQPMDGSHEKIYGRIHDIALTLQTKDYSKVPEPETEDIYVPLPPEALEQYRELEKELLLSMGDDQLPVIAPNAATLVNKLLQVTGGAVYREDRSVVTLHHAKIHAIQKLAKSPHLPMLIACNYIHEQTRLLKALPIARLWPKEGQAQFLKDWSANRVPIVIADPRSIGHGLNLQEGGANHIVWYSLPWSRELYDQFNARLVRRGQEKSVSVRRLLCPGTVDDAVAETLRQKDVGQRALLDTLSNIRRLLA